MPSLAYAQASVCTSGVVNDPDSSVYNAQAYVEQTVCLFSDSNQGYVETDNDSYAAYGNLDTLDVFGVSSEAVIEDYNGSVLFDSGMVYDITSATGGSSAIAQTSTVGYSLTGYYNECMNMPNEYSVDPNECYWDFAFEGLTVLAPGLQTATVTISSSGTPSSIGQPVTLTATITEGTTGEVLFYSGTEYIGFGNINGTTASFTTSSLPGGVSSIYSYYPGDQNYSAATSNTITQVVQKATPAVAVSCSPNSITYGPGVYGNCTASVSGGATGNVVFYLNGTGWTDPALSAGSAWFYPFGLSAGSYSVVASYGGDSDNNPASGSTTLTVLKAPSNVSLSCSPNPLTFGGGNTACTATVATGATGSITFTANGGGWTTVGLSGNTASAVGWGGGSWSAGSYQAAAYYSGDTNYNPSSSATTVAIQKATPTVAVSCSPNPATYSASTLVTTCTAITSGGTGSFTFTNGAGGSWTVPITSGSAVLPGFETFAVQTWPITATYSGDSNYNSVVASTTLVINKAVPTVAVSCSPNTIAYGSQNTTCTATVPATDGTVSFYSPTTLTGAWWNGTSSSWYPAAGGVLSSQPVAITRDGSLNYNITQDEPWPGATTAPPGVNATTIYARWTGTFVSTIGGTYTIGVNSDDGANVYVNGVALVGNLAGLQGANANLGYTQSGTISLGAGATNVILVEYQQNQGDAGIQLLWTPPGASTPSLLGWSVVPVNGSSQASISGSTLAPGVNTIWARWSGDAGFSSGSASTSITAMAATVTELSSSVNPITVGQNVTFTSLVDSGGSVPTGTVGFQDGGTNIGTGSPNEVTTTNLVPYSQQFGTSPWSGYCGSTSNMVLNSADLTAPDGTSTATKFVIASPLTCGSATSWGVLTTIPGGLQVGQIYTASVWLRGANGGENIAFGLNDCSSVGVTLTTSWQRYTVSFPSVSPSTTSCSTGPRGFQVLDNASPGATYYVWGAQVENASAAGPYIQTDASQRAGYGGAASFSTSSLSAGAQSISAVYAGDAVDSASSSAALTENVYKVTPSISITCSPGALSYGQSVACTASVGSGATGNVSWTINGGEWTTSVLNRGSTVAAGGASLLSIGVATIQASYQGDANDSAVTTSTSVIVQKATPTITVSCSPNPLAYGSQASTCMATVSGSATGTVSFSYNGNTWADPTLSGNSASASGFNGQPTGSYSIVATYSGDNNNNGAFGSTTLSIVQPITPTLSVTTSGTPSTHGSPVTFTASISSGPTGMVTFYDGGTSLGTGIVNSGTATFPTTILTAGTHSITAYWAGSANYSAVASNAVTQVVQGIGLAGASTINTVAGNGTQGYSGDGGVATAAELTYPFGGMAVDAAGNIYFNDYYSRVREVSAATGLISTVAGNGTMGYSGDGGLATNAEINAYDLAVDAAGNIYIDDGGNNRIRKVSASTGIISTVAGNGTVGYSGDGGAATSAQIDPFGLAVDAGGNIYFGNDGIYLGNDEYASPVTRKVMASTGNIATVPGALVGPYFPAVDASGNLYIPTNGYIEKTSSTTGAVISIMAGNGTLGHTGDGGPATSAEIDPSGLVLDAAGNIYIWDDDDYAIRKVTASTGIINVVAVIGGGSGCLQQSDTFGDGCLAIDGTTMLESDLGGGGTTVDGNGNIYFSDLGDSRIRGVSPIPQSQTQTTAVAVSCSPTAVIYGSNSVCSTSVSAGATGTVSLAFANASSIAEIYPGAASLVSGSTSQNLPATIHAGSNDVIATYNGDSTHLPSVGTTMLTIAPATLTVTWPTPASIQHGTPLSAVQLNASSNVPGIFSYTPTANSVLSVGMHELTAIFTPTDTIDYINPVIIYASLQVNAVTPSIVWTNPPAIQYGTPLSSVQLSATANVPGTFSYNYSSGTVLPVGIQTLNATFTPTPSTNNTSNAAVSASVQLTVNPDTPNVTAILPDPAAAGSTVTITGLNFGPAMGSNTVTFNGVTATVTSWTDNSIVTTVPARAATGSVVVTVDGVSSNSFLFMVPACP
jgi:hypothetical protein